MKLLKKALLYDISNMAYMIADTGYSSDHSLHKVRDVCEDGNIDRVARILGLAFADIVNILHPLAISPEWREDKDFSAKPGNYEIIFRSGSRGACHVTVEQKMKIKETSHEYMVAMVLADWLEMTLPEAADVWKDRALEAKSNLEEIVSSVAVTSFGAVFSRRLSPF